MAKIENLKIKIFADGANIEDFKRFSNLPYIKGFTTNPSLIKKAGIVNYEKFIKEVLPVIKRKPISLEVISDNFDKMRQEAIKLSNFGENIYVKIPIMNTTAESSIFLIDDLNTRSIKVNVTAVMTLKQVESIVKVINKTTQVIISIFAGRIADTGVDPVSIIKEARKIVKDFANIELLWASPRELLNIFQAEEAGCDIITVLPEILNKIHLIGYDLNRFSLDTVKMFYNDAVSSGLKI